VKLIFAMILLAGCAMGQTSSVNQSDCPFGGGPVPCQKVFILSGSNVVASCYALSFNANQPRAGISVSISSATNANPVVFTSTGHGFPTASIFRPTVTISGATGNWTSVNATKVATIIDANTFSIVVDSTGFGALTGTLTFTTTAPRQTVAEWAVQLFAYSGSVPVGSTWLNGSNQPVSKCSDSANTTVSAQ
jgi:hypothetical protein